MKTQLFPYNYRLNFKLKSRYIAPPPPTRLRKHKKNLKFVHAIRDTNDKRLLCRIQIVIKI